MNLAPPGLNGEKVEMGKLTVHDLVKGLPHSHESISQIAILKILSDYSETPSFLGSYPQAFFSSLEVLAILDKYRKAMDEAEKQINFKWLKPSQIPNSTAI